MKKRINIYLLILFHLYVTDLVAQNTKFDLLFEKADTLYITLGEDIVFDSPIDLCLGEQNLVWGSRESFVTFSSDDGKYINFQEHKGRGPGKFSGATHYICGPSDSLLILDTAGSKIISFNYNPEEKRYELSHEFKFPLHGARKFAYTQNAFFTLNENPLKRTGLSAITGYTNTGDKINEAGSIPYAASLQSYIIGSGGITTDNKGSIYYSYLGSHKVWKWDSHSDSVTTLNHKPSYYTGSDSTELRLINSNTSAMDEIRYAYAISRVTGLFHAEPNLIIQQFEPDNYLEGAKQKVMLEIWSTEGKKIHSAVQAPNVISFTKKDLIYIPVDFYADLMEGEGKRIAFIGYRFVGQ
ncbi:MAG: 6-bladed beta-propeller [Balneolaceae bacterium]|nr:6-bladed beta-propeller [Balneolaceae bacterium]